MQRLTARLMRRRLWRDDEGATTVMVALSMVLVLGMAAFAIDFGALQAKDSQVQDAADAAATAIAGQCFSNAGTTTVSGCATAVKNLANATATTFASATLNDGLANSATATFTLSTVTVTIADTQPSFFAQVVGIDSSTARATATAKWDRSTMAWPIAYPSCAFPATNQNHILLRYDTLNALNLSDSCGIVTSALGLGWTTGGLLGIGGKCTTDINLISYVGSIATSVAAISVLGIGGSVCDSYFSTLVGKKVLLPVYDTAVVDVVINGVLLHNQYYAKKYAVVEVTGFDFAGLLTLTTGGVSYKSNDAAAPSCTGLLGACQGIQGNYLGFVTPAQAKEMASGVALID